MELNEIQREFQGNTPIPFSLDRQFSLAIMKDDSFEIEISPAQLDMSDIALNSRKMEPEDKFTIEALGRVKFDFRHVRFGSGD